MTVRFLHYYTLEDIEKLCRWAESKGEKVRVSIEMFGKEKVIYIQRDLSELVQEEEVKTYGFSYGIKSSKDLIQFDNEDIKILTEKTKEELR